MLPSIMPAVKGSTLKVPPGIEEMRLKSGVLVQMFSEGYPEMVALGAAMTFTRTVLV